MDYVTITLRVPRQMLLDDAIEVTVPAPTAATRGPVRLDPLLLEELFWRGFTPYRCLRMYGGTQMTYRRAWQTMSLPIELSFDERKRRAPELGYDLDSPIGAS